MNTRQPIQPNNTPLVLSLALSSRRTRFVAGLSDGVKVFRTDNCLTTYQPTLPRDGGIGIVEALDDQYIAFVGGGRLPASSPNVVIFWDCVREKEVNRFDLFEPVVGLRLSSRYMVVILQERTVVFGYQELEPQQEATPLPENEGSTETLTVEKECLRGPNTIKACHATSPNVFALASLSHDALVLPAQATGQVQLIPLTGGSKRVMRVHNSAIRCMTLSPDGTVLATASEAGTLIRVFDTKTQDQLAEFRRGVDHAIIYDLAISDTNRWLACTSDKGTVHIFDLRPTPLERPTAPVPQHRKSHSSSFAHSSAQRHPPHRLSSAGNPTTTTTATQDKPSSTLSTTPSSHQTAQTQGSIQEYYGLRPPPLSSSPHTTNPPPTISSAAYSAFKTSPFAPRVMTDVRSVASAAFHMGDEPPHWQGGGSHSWVAMPGGGRKRVRNAVRALPGEPGGRPRKGVVGFEGLDKRKKRVGEGEGEEEGVRVWVVGGGGDARWEVFDVVRVGGGGGQGGGWALVKGGWRGYLTRQSVD